MSGEEGTKLEITGPERDRVIIRTSIIGIIANVFLAAVKAVVGVISNSIAITLDAVNNLSDALSSFITIIGTKLAGRKPDKKHPLGYGRIEYLTAMIIAAIIIYAGITALTESIGKIITPEEADYSAITLVILTLAIVVKLVLSRYVKAVGKKVQSGSLIASGTDAFMDAILSTSVLASAIIFIIWHISLEAYVGVLISFMILKAGGEILWGTLNDILGRRMDEDVTAAIKETICDRENVSGAYDLILHTYGPEMIVGSVHIEVPADMSAGELDQLEREIAKDVMAKHGIVLAGIGIYSVDLKDEEAMRMRREITDAVMAYEGVLQLHGFRIDIENRKVSFDVIIDFDRKDRDELCDRIVSDLHERYPDYSLGITLDVDI